MKNIARLLIIMFVAVVPLAAQGLDVTKKPEPIDKKEFVFPEYNSVMLENGMRAYFIKDDEQPTFVMRVLIPGGSSIEGEKTGLADITTGLMTKGAAGMSAFEIARKLDGVGASLSVSAGGDYVQIVVSCLKKHVPLVLETMNDVLTKPEFPQDEFDKLVKQMIAGIQYEKSEPGAVSTKLAKKTIYGEDHPYAQHATEKSIKSITIDDVKDYYNKYIVPNYATVAVIGDIDPADIKPEIEKALAGWNKGKDYEIEIPKANPMPKGVYFISRPASVQSVVSYNTAGVGFAHPDYETLDMAASVIGAGFAGRLFRTLREKYSYTYTPFGYLTSSKYTNRFSCGADVRNSVTDSALNVIFNQINDLAQNGPADDELMRVKNYTIGSYLMNFESSEFIASLVQDADFYGIPIGKVKNYPDRAGKITAREIRKAAAKYLSPADA
ncbi:MAG: M16 family metallopeptidase, partial [Candidatus Kapaibacterium sp.]